MAVAESPGVSSIVKLIRGKALLGGPRFSLGGRSIMLGPYDSAESHDRHFAQTYGSGDPILDSTDELRFSPETSQLVSFRIGVPEAPCDDEAFLRSLRKSAAEPGLPWFPAGGDFQVVVSTSMYIDAEGRQLVVFNRAMTDDLRRIGVAADVEMVMSADRVAGLSLDNPAQYLADGWSPVKGGDEVAALSPILAAYLRAVNDAFVVRLEDGDVVARDTLASLRRAAKSSPPSPQQRVLFDVIDSVIQTFFDDVPG